ELESRGETVGLSVLGRALQAAPRSRPGCFAARIRFSAAPVRAAPAFSAGLLSRPGLGSRPRLRRGFAVAPRRWTDFEEQVGELAPHDAKSFFDLIELGLRDVAKVQRSNQVMQCFVSFADRDL